MISILLVIHVLLSLSIIGLVMLQRGKGADAGAALGGGGGGGGASGSVFGARGAANFLSRTTAVLAAAFFSTSLGLAYFSANMNAESSVGNGSVMEQPADVRHSDIPQAESQIESIMPASDMSGAKKSPASDIPASE